MIAVISSLLLMAAVSAQAQPPPEWTVNPADYEYFMTVTAELTVDGEVVADTNTVVAAFINGECRGVASPSLVEETTLYFLMVYGEAHRVDISFRAYYTPHDTILVLTDSLDFQSGGAVGSPGDPFMLHSTLGIVRVREATGPIPDLQLFPNYPNPFNPETTIQYTLNFSTRVTLTVYDARGDLVRILWKAQQRAGDYTVRWDGRDGNGEQVSSGMYLYRLNTPEFQESRKMLLMK